MDAMLIIFRTLVPPDQRQLAALVAAQGGPEAVRANKSLLRSLDPDAVEQDDFFDAPDTTIAKNRDVFLRKFEVQKAQIVQELTAVVERESDRIIKEISAGAHDRCASFLYLLHHALITMYIDRVKDRDIHDLWCDMVRCLSVR
jgi:hypothetical protein